MVLLGENSERLKKVALTATASVVGGAVVRYVWNDERILGYVYNLKDTSGSFFIGLINESWGITSEFTGRILRKAGAIPEVVLTDTRLSTEEVYQLEETFEVNINSEEN